MKAMADADNESTDDTARIDAVVLIKTGILNRDDRVLHIERNLLNRNRDTVSLSLTIFCVERICSTVGLLI